MPKDIWPQLKQFNAEFCVNDPLQEAERCVRKSLQINPDCQHAHMSLGWLYVVSHRDKDRAFKSFEYCLSINPKSAFFLGSGGILPS